MYPRNICLYIYNKWKIYLKVSKSRIVLLRSQRNSFAKVRSVVYVQCTGLRYTYWSQATSIHRSPRHGIETCPIGEKYLVKSSTSLHDQSMLTSMRGPGIGTCQEWNLNTWPRPNIIHSMANVPYIWTPPQVESQQPKRCIARTQECRPWASKCKHMPHICVNIQLQGLIRAYNAKL